jgi:hypothetical protein
LRIERVAPGRLRVTGELDRSNAQILSEAVRIAVTGVPPGAAVRSNARVSASSIPRARRPSSTPRERSGPTAVCSFTSRGAIAGRVLGLPPPTEPSLIVASDDVALQRGS